MTLAEKFESKMAKMKDKSINQKASFDVMYSTGFLSIDYLNGTVIYVEDKKNGREFSYNSCGIVDGSTNTIIGRSGSGKSTLITQITTGIIHPFVAQGNEEVHVYIDDIEGSLPEARKYFLLNVTPEEAEKYVSIRNTGITSQNLYQRIQYLHDLKIEESDKYMYDTGLFDLEGNRIYKYVPTVYLVDSLPMLLPKDLVDNDELGGSMSASSIAKVNTQLFKKISQLCKEANIIFFTVNHILDDIETNPFAKKAAQIAGLKQGERLPGGKAAIYLANNMFRVDDSLQLKRDKDYGIDGSIVTLTIIKSRTNANRRKIPLIFDKSQGKFDDVLSYFHLMNEEGIFQGTGSYYFAELPNSKFTKKNVKERLAADPELAQVFMKNLHALLVTYLSDTHVVKTEAKTLSESLTDIFNGFNILEAA